MSALRNKICHAALVGLILIEAGHGYSAERTAAEVMSAYLRYVAVYTTWPGGPAADADRPILIGVIGDDPNGVMTPIESHLNSGKKLLAKNRPIQMAHVSSTTDGENLDLLTSCALLFLSEGAGDEWERIRPAVSALPIVTVSEMRGFAERGGMIEYLIDRRGGNVRMKINLQSIREAGISLSSHLLSLETVILLDEEEDG